MKYKFLRLEKNKIKSENGDVPCYWEIGQWKKEENIDICHTGFHCSNTILDALYWVNGEVLAIVKTKGESVKQKDKECWQEMKIIKAYNWTKEDSLQLAIFSAELVLPIFEKQCPSDDRPRKAIEAAKKVLQNNTKKNRLAAAYAAYAADAAYAAAYAAADAADAAAHAAADAAAYAAAHAAVISKINKWLINHIKDLKEIT